MNEQWFNVTITDDFMPNKRTARQQYYCVRATDKDNALKVLREEMPISFLYAKAIEVYPTTNPRILSQGIVRVSRERAEEAYQRAQEVSQ